MKKQFGWILLILILISILIVAYITISRNIFGTDIFDAFYNYLSGTYGKLK